MTESKTPAPVPHVEASKECGCFGDSGLHASTHVPVGSDREHCDLCGYPVPEDSTDVLSAINQPPVLNVVPTIELLADLIDDAAPGILRPDTRLQIASRLRAALATTEGSDNG